MAGLIVTLSLITLATVSPWLMLIALVPLAWTLWVWRAGTDAGPDGLRVRALLGTRLVPWPDVQALVTDPRGRVTAVLGNGNALPLPGVTAADLPRLAAASGDRARSGPDR